ncbi:alpha/beta fold hydrolase [Virgifigura deserti]|uniref:alpha/beta fold hydrolase n=1 Tax=Virgifigura deserti TaxID=2268457 RepID=UPI003CCBE93E
MTGRRLPMTESPKAQSRPRHRLGPRPLPQHLALAATAWLSSSAGLALLKSGSLVSKAAADAPQVSALRAELRNADPEALAAAVEAEARRRFAAFLTGVDRYRRHPYRRTLVDPPVLWREGTTRLLDYGAVDGLRTARRGEPALLVIPSLVNRAQILDLTAEQSLMRYLARRGLRPILVDWDRPGPAERSFTLTDYIAGRLERALDAVIGATGGPVAVVGYCMGGLLALALALRRAEDLTGLACLATPWDFHAGDFHAGQPGQARLAGAVAGSLDPLLQTLQELPVDLIQALFTVIDPFGVVRKFRGFAALEVDSPQARRFVALEDWLNDGVSLAASVARECLAGWYAANTPARGSWRVAGRPVLPERLTLPSLVVLPDRDRIVPPASAQALARALPQAVQLRPAAGHIGMIVGRGAEARLWQPLADWLANLGN